MPRRRNGKKTADRDRDDFQDPSTSADEEYTRRQWSFKAPSNPILVKRDSLPPLRNRYEKGNDNKWRLVEN